ncbi:MAG: hypothetical protein Q8S73_02620 [Deltaproteobacteria bacterium]|nr:hypothetical protein [Deltaproteobacteria bacterium]
MDRAIAIEELNVVAWLLANAAMVDVSNLRADSLQGARVIAGCDCGCASIDFVRAGEIVDSSIAADALTFWPDGSRGGVILWAGQDRILGIELYDVDPSSSHRFPTVDVLRRWEDFYEEDGSAR